MSEDTERLAITTDLGAATIQDAIRDGVGIAILLVVAGFVSVLPGAGRDLPGTGIAIGALFLAAISLAIVAAILDAASSVRAVVVAALEGPPDVVRDFAEATRYAFVFLAVVVAYAGLAPVVVPLIAPDAAWIYDIAFTGFALFPVVGIARRLHRNTDVLARDLATVLARPASAPPGEAQPDRTRSS